jgi:hypothetical protein
MIDLRLAETRGLPSLPVPHRVRHRREVKMMNAFVASLDLLEPPPNWDAALLSLWWDARGDWNKAHALAQEDESSPRSAWVHAYLHRKEGDLSNAAYWYRRAGRPEGRGSLETELREIGAVLLAESAGTTS